MFGRRPDGRAVGSHVDPLTRLLPYIMLTRNDALVNSTQYVESEVLSDYIRKKRDEGLRITHMELMIAAFVRVVSQMPQFNRYIVGRKLYARKELTVSFAILKERSASHIVETTVKIFFDPTDTIYDVAKRVNKAVSENKTVEDENDTDKLVNVLLSIPGLLTVAVGLLKFLDRLGWLPKKIIDLSPFHSSLFLTNMGSIKMEYVHHHIYNFGTTSFFFGVGKKSTRVRLKRDGSLAGVRCYPIGVVNDERISPGGALGLGLSMFHSLLKTPEKLELPPENVVYDIGLEYHQPKPE